MTRPSENLPRRVLIVSSHPLFSQGLRSLLHERKEEGVVVVGVVTNVDEAVAALKTHAPDLVVVDHDDEQVNRDEFLAHFVEGAKRLRVVLLSLKEDGSQAIVYDRRMLAAAKIDDWLKEWNEDGTALLEAPSASEGAGFSPEASVQGAPQRRPSRISLSRRRKRSKGRSLKTVKSDLAEENEDKPIRGDQK